MRALFMAIVLCITCSCAGKYPYIDLRHPIYMVTDKSFWAGCEEDPAGYESCRNDRITKIRVGANQWFNYFDSAARPRVVIVRTKEELPPHRVNKVIYLKIDKDLCGMATRTIIAAACYDWWDSSALKIVFRDESFIISRLAAHELGHALGRDDNDVPIGTGSVMSYTNPTKVLLSDIKMMCRLHRECRMEKKKMKKN